jgi:phospholipid/cholesterol/gamma-HCH transport system ATP-binding protein
MSDALIQALDLTIGWEKNVLQRDANFEVQRGDIFVILGGSGCGKSTMLRHLIGLETPLGGQVLIDGKPPSVEVGRPSHGVMFQSGALLGSMTLGENVGLPLISWTELSHDAVSAIVQAKLRLVGLHGCEDKMPSELSGGMKKRAGIARAMALEPELLFLDEPSAGLDPVNAFEVDELILALNKSMGLTFVVVTHDLDSMFKIGSSCIMLDRETQSIIARGDPRELRDTSDDPRVRSFFNRTGKEAA